MDYFEKVRLRFKFFAMGLVIVGPVLIGMFWNETWLAISSNKWPSVQGTIRDTIVKTYQDKERQVKYYGRARYDYEVNGKQYTSDLTDFGPGTKRTDQMQALADVAEYQPGATAPVYYDPANPSIAVLRPGMHPVRKAVMIAMCVATVVGFVACVVNLRRWLESRSEADKNWPAQHAEAP